MGDLEKLDVVIKDINNINFKDNVVTASLTFIDG